MSGFLASTSSTALVPSAEASPANSLDAWVPPAEKLGPPGRGRDFARFAQLQADLRRCCGSLLHFAGRELEALEQGDDAELSKLAKGLRGQELADSICGFQQSFQALAQRFEAGEKLRVVFIGPVKAGKSTLINVLLTSCLGACQMLLPIDSTAATNCIWKVESCEGREASVLRAGQTLHTWPLEAGAGDSARSAVCAEIAEFLETALGRDAEPLNRSEVTLRLPLAFVDPFGCHYCLVDTPGYTESEEYEVLVTKFLQDHSHIACVACPLIGGLAMPEATRSMLQRSYGPKFWVLTRYDSLIMDTPRGRMGSSKRKSVEGTLAKFREQIQAADPGARVFLQAAQLLLPEEEDGTWVKVMEPHLTPGEAGAWLQEIRAHVKECFLAIQQEQHVLSSQSRQCLDLATKVYQEYQRLKDGAQGAMAVNDFCMLELQTCAEATAETLHREIRQEIDKVTAGGELLRLCGEAGQKAQRREKTFYSEQAYFEAVLANVAPIVEVELAGRFAAAVDRASQHVRDTAQKLLAQAGAGNGGGSGLTSGQDVFIPGSSHLSSRYPKESVLTLSLVSAATGAAAVTEAGASLLVGLGLKVGTLAVAGSVGALVVGVATMGYAVKKATEIQPFWRYKTVEEDAAQKLRQANQWNILAEAYSGRARVQLLSGVARLRCRLSAVLLARGTPREVLVQVFPDLPLFEALRFRLEQVCKDISEFVDCPDLSGRADGDLQVCAERAALQWDGIVEQTEAYVQPNARTDKVRAELLARLLAFRCEALVRFFACGEASRTADIFRETFPQLCLPQVYCVASKILFDYLAGALDQSAARQCTTACAELLSSPEHLGEVPRLTEAWFHAVAASYLGQAARQEHADRLAGVLRCIVAQQMKEKPNRYQIRCKSVECLRARFAAMRQELGSDVLNVLNRWTRGEELSDTGHNAELEEVSQEAEREYEKACTSFANGAVNCVHMVLAALPPAHIDMEGLGPLVVAKLLELAEAQCLREPAVEPHVWAEIKALLCPIDGGNVHSLGEEWVRLLGDALARRGTG